MISRISLQGIQVAYDLSKSKRAKNVRITVREDSTLHVSIPREISLHVAEAFMQKKSDWILKKIKEAESRRGDTLLVQRKHISKLKREALLLALSRLPYFNRHFYGFTYNKVRIKNQKSRWGSCSKKGNLNFNCKIALLPSHLSDYIIVHELCHLSEFNHGKAFWDLVERAIPDYKSRRNTLKWLKIRFK